MKFSEVAVGQKFTCNGEEYKKTETRKVSCCKTLNAVKTANNEQAMIKNDQQVELVTE